MGICYTEDMCRKYLKPHSYVFPPTDDTRILSFDEVLQRWQIDPVYGTGSYVNACADYPGIYYSHYMNETVGSGRVLLYGLDNSSGTGWIAGSSSLGSYVWYAPPSANVSGADSFDDAYTNTYYITLNRTSTGAPAAWAAKNYNADTVEWVLPGATQAQWIDNLRQTYGGWASTSYFWTSTNAGFSSAVMFDFIQHQGVVENKYNSHDVIPVRAYNDGILYFYVTETHVNSGSNVSVTWAVSFRSYSGGLLPQVTSPNKAGSYFFMIGYTDTVNHGDTYGYLGLTNGLTDTLYITVDYPMGDFGYWATCGDYYNASWGQECAQTAAVWIPGIA